MAEVRSRETEEVTLRARQRFQEELESVRQERDELKAILLSTLKRLEVVEEIACKQDASHAVMVERLRALEQEKERALNDAAGEHAGRGGDNSCASFYCLRFNTGTAPHVYGSPTAVLLMGSALSRSSLLILSL